MGIHFDSLVKLLSKGKGSEENINGTSVNQYLCRLVRNASLFQFQIPKEDIRPKDEELLEYVVYLDDYFDLSRQREDQHFVIPFGMAAIEDDKTVVILDHMFENKYHALVCFKNQKLHYTTILIGETEISSIQEKGVEVNVKPLYAVQDGNGKTLYCMLNTVEGRFFAEEDIRNAVTGYVQQVVYLMDPENFILQEEKKRTRQEKKSLEKEDHKGLLRVTVQRPIYVGLSREDIVASLKGESIDTLGFRPVIGHWRKLISERYTNKQFQKIDVRQYCTGYTPGRIEGSNGWVFQLMIKESLTKIVPFRGNK